MSAIQFKPEHFNIPSDPSLMMDTCGSYEIENHLVWRLIKHIEFDIPFENPIGGSHYHNNLVEKGYLIEVKEKAYIFTRKSLGLLWSVYGKLPEKTYSEENVISELTEFADQNGLLSSKQDIKQFNQYIKERFDS